MNIILKEIYSSELERNKKLRIYLPSDYHKNNTSYPVLYMHDGQNIFKDKNESISGLSWDIDQILNKLKKQCIVVGVDSSQEKYERYNEYSPWKNSIESTLSTFLNIPKNIGGKGDKYSLFFVETLKNYIDSNYRTLDDFNNTYIAGSSMGAIISLYTVLKYPKIFSKVGLFSIATWFCQDELLTFIKNNDIPKNIKFYMDIGTQETSSDACIYFPEIYLDGFFKIKNAILEKNISKSYLFSTIEPKALHNEKAWNRRFPLFYDFIRRDDLL